MIEKKTDDLSSRTDLGNCISILFSTSDPCGNMRFQGTTAHAIARSVAPEARRSRPSQNDVLWKYAECAVSSESSVNLIWVNFEASKWNSNTRWRMWEHDHIEIVSTSRCNNENSTFIENSRCKWIQSATCKDAIFLRVKVSIRSSVNGEVDRGVNIFKRHAVIPFSWCVWIPNFHSYHGLNQICSIVMDCKYVVLHAILEAKYFREYDKLVKALTRQR